MKPKRIRAWAVVNRNGRVVSTARHKGTLIAWCKSQNGNGAFRPYALVPLTGTFTPKKAGKGAKR